MSESRQTSPFPAPPSQEPVPKTAGLTHHHRTLPLHPLALEETRRFRQDIVISTDGQPEQGITGPSPGPRAPDPHRQPLKWASPDCKKSQVHTGICMGVGSPHPSLLTLHMYDLHTLFLPVTPSHLPTNLSSSPLGISEPTYNRDSPISFQVHSLKSQQSIMISIVKSVYTFGGYLLWYSSSIASILPAMWAHNTTHTHTRHSLSFLKLIIYVYGQIHTDLMHVSITYVI